MRAVCIPHKVSHKVVRRWADWKNHLFVETACGEKIQIVVRTRGEAWDPCPKCPSNAGGGSPATA